MPFPAGLRQEIFKVKNENPGISEENAFSLAWDRFQAMKNQPTVPTEQQMQNQSAWTGVK
jgi:hypothetical protein